MDRKQVIRLDLELQPFICRAYIRISLAELKERVSNREAMKGAHIK